MVDKVINSMIAGIVGAVAFLAIRALVNSSFYGENGDEAYGVVNNSVACSANASNCTWHDPTAGELMIHDILPLAIAIMVIAGIFIGMTKMKGV